MADYLLQPFRAQRYLASDRSRAALVAELLAPTPSLLDAGAAYVDDDEGPVPIGDAILCELELSRIDRDLTAAEQRLCDLLTAISSIRGGRLADELDFAYGYLAETEVGELAILLGEVELETTVGAAAKLAHCAWNLAEQRLGLFVGCHP